METLLPIVDGDIIAFQAATLAEQPVHWGDGQWTLHCFDEDVEYLVDSLMGNIRYTIDACIEAQREGAQQADEPIVCLSSSNNFRKLLYPDYKENRAKQRKPMRLQYAKHLLATRYDSRTVEGLEADDTMGVLMACLEEGDDIVPVVVSEDKDLLQIPGHHLHWDENDRTHFFTIVSESEAIKNFYKQVLSGDATDNIKGCPGIGEGKAEDIIEGRKMAHKETSVIKSGKNKGEERVQWKVTEGHTDALWDEIVFSHFLRVYGTENSDQVSPAVTKAMQLVGIKGCPAVPLYDGLSDEQMDALEQFIVDEEAT